MKAESRFNLEEWCGLLRYDGVVPQASPPSDRALLRSDAERNRRRILAAARKLIAERGLGVGYHEIAQEADVGVGTVYRRFPTRDRLFQELFQDRVAAVVAIAEEALTIEDPWLGLCLFMQRDFELQSADRGLREFLLGRVDSPDLARRSRERIQPLVTRLVERAQEAGRLRPDVGQSDIAIILAMIGNLIDSSLHVDPDLWRRYLAIVLDGIQRGDLRDELPGKPPDQPQLDRILPGWVPPRRGQGAPRDPESAPRRGAARSSARS